MAVTIVEYSTVNKATANCYSTLEKADAYFNTDTRFAIWDAFDTDTQSRALIQATRHIDSAEIAGGKLDPFTPQNTRFPLLGMSDAIPAEVRDACHEEAFDILTNPQRDFVNAAKHAGISSASHPGQSMSISGGTRKICYRAKDLLARWITTSARAV